MCKLKPKEQSFLADAELAKLDVINKLIKETNPNDRTRLYALNKMTHDKYMAVAQLHHDAYVALKNAQTFGPSWINAHEKAEKKCRRKAAIFLEYCTCLDQLKEITGSY